MLPFNAAGLFANVEFNAQVAVNGLVTGATYGVLAVGLILVYRANRVVNLAYGEIGAFAAALLARMVINWDIPFGIALAAALAVGAVIGAALEASVVRRLARAPRVIVMVATLGAAQLALLAQLRLPDLERFERYPTPFRSTWTVGDVVLRSEHLAILVVVPVVTIVLAGFLGRTRVGTAIRASAANPDAARLAAIPVRRLSTVVWAIAGALAALTAILIAPGRGSTAATTVALGPSLLVRALAPALVARMRSLPVALGCGLLLGVVEALLFFNDQADPGRIDAVLFVITLAAVFAVGRQARVDVSPWRYSPRSRPIPAALAGTRWLVRLPAVLIATASALAVALPYLVDRPSRHALWAKIALFALVGLSLTVLSGWIGQLSLGQFALVGWSTMVTASLINGMALRVGDTRFELRSIPFEFAVPIAATSTVVLALLVGAPALRIRGLLLAVTTLAFAVMAQTWLLERPFLTGGRPIVTVGRPRFGDVVSFESTRSYYYLCLGALVIGIIVLRRVQSSGVGRSLRAVRDNEQAAAAFTISPVRAKLLAFALSGAYAGVAGALMASLLVQIEPDRVFTPDESLRIVAIAVIGGLASITGAVLGALWVIGLPTFFGDARTAQLLTSGIGLMVLLMYLPGGLVQIIDSTRGAIYEQLARRRTRTAPPNSSSDHSVAIRTSLPTSSPTQRDQADRLRRRASEPTSHVSLAVRGVYVAFGGRVAVDGVDLAVQSQEIVGLIGTNGAGKSTLMNAIGGFVPSRGTIELAGTEVTTWSAARRARAGLGRTFQNAELFGDLTVRETLLVSLEARGRAHLWSTIASLPHARRGERAKRAETEELIAYFGLGRYGDHFVSDLSTGTRRIVELACLMGVDARLLCLDEPTAGVAQRETEALAPLILRVRQELSAALLVIEHDMPFIMGISDRVICLEAGHVIAEGSPDAVRNDPLVIASYLGSDRRAIDRSDAKVTSPSASPGIPSSPA